jgi:hypothetical protein
MKYLFSIVSAIFFSFSLFFSGTMVNADYQAFPHDHSQEDCAPPLVCPTTPESTEEGEISTVGYGNLVPCNGPECNACLLVQLGENLLNWLIGVLMVIFSIIIAWAGFKLVISGGNVQAKSEAKSMITNALIGLIVVLAGWLIVDTAMRMLLVGGEGKLNSKPWSTIECVDPFTLFKTAGPGCSVVKEGVICTAEETVVDVQKCSIKTDEDGRTLKCIERLSTGDAAIDGKQEGCVVNEEKSTDERTHIDCTGDGRHTKPYPTCAGPMSSGDGTVTSFTCPIERGRYPSVCNDTKTFDSLGRSIIKCPNQTPANIMIGCSKKAEGLTSGWLSDTWFCTQD